jgi:hypothetical protein
MEVRRAVKGRDERPKKTGALDSPPNPEGRSVSDFSLDMADDFIDRQQWCQLSWVWRIDSERAKR